MVDMPSPSSDDEAPRAKRQKIDFFTTVSVLAGSEETPFTVHRDRLCADSPFFKTACNEQWLKGKEKTIRLPTVTTNTFTPYCHWIYTGKIALDLVESLMDDHDPTKLSRSAREHRCGNVIVRLFVAASSVLNRVLQNAIMDEWVSRPDSFGIGADTINYVWESTEGTSPLRYHILDLSVSGSNVRALMKIMGLLCKEYVSDLAMALCDFRLSHLEDYCPVSDISCDYHRHKDRAAVCARRSPS